MDDCTTGPRDALAGRAAGGDALELVGEVDMKRGVAALSALGHELRRLLAQCHIVERLDEILVGCCNGLAEREHGGERRQEVAHGAGQGSAHG
jgi:hypothetical protein